MKFIILLFSAALLSGCSAMLVPASSDPNVKLKQAQALMSVGRPIPSERIAIEALELFKGSKDKFGESEANFFLGIFYKAKSGWGNVSSEEYLNKSIKHLSSSAMGFQSIGESIQASKSVFEIGQAYRGKEDLISACKNYEKSLDLYGTKKGLHKLFRVNNPKFNSPKDLIEAHIEALCSENV